MPTSGFLRGALQMARRWNRATEGLPPPLASTLPAIGRRHLLKLMGGSAGLLAASPALAQPRAGTVAIIGGGLAGLNALRILTEAGVEARLYEARRRTGGRVHSLTDAIAPGLTVEMGGQFINSDHEDMIGLARLYGIGLFDRHRLTGQEQVVSQRRLLATSDLARALAPLAAQIARDSEAIDADPDSAAPALDRLSVADYLARHAALIPDGAARRLLIQTIRTEYGAEPRDASALQLIFNLPTVHGDAFETLGDSDERYVVEGGSARIPDALAGAHAARIETGRPLVALRPGGQGGVQLRFADGGTAEADRVILTLPASVLADIDHGGLFGAPWRAFAKEVRLGRNAKLNAPYRSRPWLAGMGPAGATWDAGPAALFGEAWDATLGQAGAAGVLTWYLGGDQCEGVARQSLRDAVEAAVADSMGDLATARLDGAQRTSWIKDRFTKGSYLNFRPGQFTRFGRLLWLEEKGIPTQIAKSGPILFAGEHLSDAWPGFMNGGAQTGRLAAQAILNGV